jgi:polyvinyl alcohol dehydrogenase (cytochrome)
MEMTGSGGGAVRATGGVLLAGLALIWGFWDPPAAMASAPCYATTSGGQWPSYGHDTANTRTQPEETQLGPSAVSGIKVAWTFSTSSTGDGGAFNTTPVVDGGCVYIGSSGGTAYALDAGSGRVVWDRKLEAPKPGSGGAIVGAAAIYGREVIFLVDEFAAPYAVALNRSTGAVIWKSAPFAPPLNASVAQEGSYTNASPVVAGHYILAGYSEPEGDPTATGGFSVIDASSGEVVRTTPTIPPAAQEEGFAGGGLWSTPAFDPATKYAYWGAGNPNSKTKQYPTTDAILKIDMNPARPTFGQIVAYYDGNVDQYTQAIQELSDGPACEASNNPQVPYPLDDPACGQLDLDFGASANLFTTSTGRKVVGDLQKSGVYHVADAKTMKPVWSTLLGASCAPCNAASAAFDGSSVDGVATPGGTAFSLNRTSGAVNWLSPIGDAIHYQSVSTADGVVWTVDSLGNLDAFEAASGQPLLRRPLSVDAGAPVSDLTSSGVAIAEHRLFVAAGGAAYASAPGYLIAYTP